MEPHVIVNKLVARVRAEATGSSIDIREAFERVLEQLLAETPTESPWHDGKDIIGTAYESLIHSSQRRAAGQFFTPLWAGDLMSGWLYASSPKLLLDPGCGSGSLIVSAARHPERSLARILGIDRDPLAIRMAEANCALRSLKGIDLKVGDFMLDEIGSQPDAVICNPPYIRHQNISNSDKCQFHAAIQKNFKIKLNRLTGMPVLFLLRCLEVAAPQARMAFITPAHWLDIDYALPVKQLLLERTHIESIILLEERSPFFGRALTTAAVTLISTEQKRDTTTSIVHLGRTLPSPESVLEAINDIGNSNIKIEHVSLRVEDRWARPCTARKRNFRGIRLGDLARVRRGVATGANAFFVLSENHRKELSLPISKLRPCITSPKLFPGNEITSDCLEELDDDAPRWLINASDPLDETRDDALGGYLRYGRCVLKIKERTLPSHRRIWFEPEQRALCPILFTYINRKNPRFIRNRTNATALNNWIIIEPLKNIDADDLWNSLQRPTIFQQLTRNSRAYGHGMWKLEPRELSDIRVVIP